MWVPRYGLSLVGVHSGVNGTPALFIDGVRYDGERDVGSLVAMLQAAADASAQLQAK